MRAIQRGNYSAFFFFLVCLIRPSNITGKDSKNFSSLPALSSAAGGAMLPLNQHMDLVPGDITLKVEPQT